MPLNAKERARYELCKETIKEKMQGSIDLGMALREIRVGKLYREDYDTFDDFLLKEYQLSRSYASRLIGFVEVKESIADSKHADAIVNEAQARALSAVPEENRAKVLKEAVKSGEVTAQTIKAAAAEVVAPKAEPEKPKAPEPPKPAPKQLDEMGTVIPLAVLPFWERREEVQGLLTQLSNIKKVIEDSYQKGDPMYKRIYAQAVNDLSCVRRLISEAKPEVVCGKCNGRPNVQPAGCAYCNNTGFQSKAVYKKNTELGLQTMREAANKRHAQAVA